MSQFKRFNTSDASNYDSGAAYPEGTLTWDQNNGLRLHDGNTGGGNAVGGSSFSGNFYDLYNRPNGLTAVHDLIGGASSVDTGKFLQQTGTGTSAWEPIPTTYDTLTINTKVLGGIVGAGGTQITDINVGQLGSGAPYRYVFLGGNDAFGNLFNRGSSIIGWKMYPASDPSAFVTITEFLNNDLGGPSLGFSGGLQGGPWVAESPDYNAGTPGPLTLSANSANFVLGTDGSLTLPGSVTIKSNVTTNTGTGVGSLAGATVTIWTASSTDVQAAQIVYRANVNYGQNIEIGSVYAVKDSAGNVNVAGIDAAKSSAFTNVIIAGGIDDDGKLYITASPGTSDDANFLVSVTEFN